MDNEFTTLIDNTIISQIRDIADANGGNTHKQVIVIRKDLNMRKGKIAAQAAHASWKAILDTSSMEEDIVGQYETQTYLRIPLTDKVRPWLLSNFKKVCVYVNSEQELLDIYREAKACNVLCSLIQDSGLTEFGGVPTYTAVAVGPDWNGNIDPITGRLQLL